jgi:hypothetical protein
MKREAGIAESVQQQTVAGVRFPVGTTDFSLLHSLQIGSEAHPASYPMGTGGSSPGGKAVGE